jgi:hypothetical protein
MAIALHAEMNNALVINSEQTLWNDTARILILFSWRGARSPLLARTNT